ncbi:MAG: AAA family ATPase [Planctomycetaceae bacterium]|nr:AAA family ATPase [Planctomycetaceae bacterium]
MSSIPTIHRYRTMQTLGSRVRRDLANSDFVFVYAYNRVGKTRLSMEFKEAGKRQNKGTPDTLYFNAYTEDLFTWDNDFEDDSDRKLRINSESKFFAGLRDLALEESIQAYLGRYADFDFDIDYTAWTVSFRKGDNSNIKISRGEENIFIWCLFMAICERVIDGQESYSWVKYFYIDDPISSLDDNNAIAVASDLAKLLKKGRGRCKAVISSHHALFFNVIANEFKKIPHKKYFLDRPRNGDELTLRATDDTPFFHHVAMLSELQSAAESGILYTYHFNMLRSVLEKTAVFFGYHSFADCLDGEKDQAFYSRALNVLSHGAYSLYEPREMGDDNKSLFQDILTAFFTRYSFALPDLLEKTAATPAQAAIVAVAPAAIPAQAATVAVAPAAASAQAASASPGPAQ